jgi:hypothetical protein
MFIIELKIKKNDQWSGKWIAGICSREREAQELFVKIPVKDRIEKKLHSLSGFTYPFFIVEDATKFTFFRSKNAVLEMIQTLERVPDDDHCYFTLYICAEDFKSDPPNKDMMGILPHFHVENKELREFRAGEFDSYIERYLQKI